MYIEREREREIHRGAAEHEKEAQESSKRDTKEVLILPLWLYSEPPLKEPVEQLNAAASG